MADQEYGADQIQVLENLDPVRKRPGMYIASTNSAGLHHLVWEVVDNAVDEAMAGHCDLIEVTIHEDESVSVQDNGRGVPVSPQRSGTYKGMPTVEMIMTVLHAGGKFGTGAYSYSGGLHGVGVSVVNALSEWVEVTVDRDKERHFISFHVVEDVVDGVSKVVPGRVKEPLQRVKSVPARQTGTLVRFKPDETVFSTTYWDAELVSRRLRNTSFLNPGLRCVLVDERDGGSERVEHYYPGGLVDFMKALTGSRLKEWRDRDGEGNETEAAALAPILQEPALLKGSDERSGEWQVCLQWFPDNWQRILSYANGIETVDGGTHVDGFQMVLTRLMNSYARQSHVAALSDKDPNLEAQDVRSGLGCIVSVRIPDPQFQGQTKAKLGNGDVKDMVRAGVYDALWSWMEEHPTEALSAIDKMVREMRLRHRMAELQRKERAAQERQGHAPKSQPLPTKLYDCEARGKSGGELFIVEGDSAAGSAIPARDPKTQAILPLKGKILNVHVSDDRRIASNAEIQGIIAAVGAGSEDYFDLSAARYERVIILTDADDDGRHIELLLMTMFYELMLPMVQDGRVYVARTPLFSTVIKDQKVYVYTEEDKEAYDAKHKGLNWTRFKGLGEMNSSELGATAIDPDTRRLSRLVVDDLPSVDEAVDNLMGSDASTKWDALSAIQVDDAEAASL